MHTLYHIASNLYIFICRVNKVMFCFFQGAVGWGPLFVFSAVEVEDKVSIEEMALSGNGVRE